MVILIVPALTLAAIAAAAVPRRLAAQAAVDSAAAQLAVMAAHWRHAQDRPHGPLDWYYPDCTTRTGTAAEQPALKSMCEAAAESIDAALGAARVDAGRLAGYHTSSLSTALANAGEHQPSVPCRIGHQTVAADAVHAAVAVPFGADDWAAGQIWPRGITLQAHATGHITEAGDDTAEKLPDCTLLAAPNDPALTDRVPGASAFGNVSTP